MSFLSGIGKIGKWIGDEAGSIYHGLTGTMDASQKRSMMQGIQDQANFYKQQTEISQKAIDDARAQEDVQKRMIQEKQIRSLRNRYRAPGFMDSVSGAADPNLASNLGG